MKTFGGIVSFLLLPVLLFAQSITFDVNAPNIVEVGEQFQLSYTASARPSQFTPPTISDFEVLAGPSTSFSSSFQNINGKVTQTQTYSYTYVLEATKEGKFTIPPAEAVFNKETVTSKPITIEVVKSSNNNTNQNINRRVSNNQQPSSRNLPDDAIYAIVEVDKNTAYVGEPITAIIKIYTSVNIVDFDNPKFPSFNGFWSQELETSSNVNFQRVNVNGKLYNMGIIRKYILYPQKVDELTIDPFELGVIYQAPSNAPRSIFDEFFGGSATFRKQVSSKPVKIRVKKLPPNAPESFYGAVGKYSIKANIDKNKLKTNEALTLSLKVVGNGNVKLISTPNISYPSSFEAFDPKIKENIGKHDNNGNDSKTFDYVLIPRTPGKYRIDPVEFTYFDLRDKQYKTLKSDAFNIEVSADTTSDQHVVTGSYNKEDIKFIGKDIRYIKSKPGFLKPIGRFIVSSGVYQLIYIIFIILFALFFVIYHKHIQRISDVKFVKMKKANKVARKRLQTAKLLLGQNNAAAFYDEISKTLWGYASDKLNIPVANLNSDNIRESLLKYDSQQEDTEEFLRIIDECEFARFAPGADYSQMNSLYQDTYSLLTKLENILGRVR
ncbi:MAG TPA: BatD family protein [Tenuifilaceae bacterium]|nr:BatD family protein [Tenuifilaceae bacterium]